MTDEELDRARAIEGHLLAGYPKETLASLASIHTARLAREGWMPPDPIEAEVDKICSSNGVLLSRHVVRAAIKRGIEIGRSK